MPYMCPGGAWVCVFRVFTCWCVQSLLGGVGGAGMCTRAFLGEVGVCAHATNPCAGTEGYLGQAPGAEP